MRTLMTAAAAALLLSGGAAVAHHGWAAYSDKDGEVRGVVETASLGQPHGLIKVRARDGVWDVMLAPPGGDRAVRADACGGSQGRDRDRARAQARGWNS